MWLKEGANDYPGEVGGDLPLKAKILVFFFFLCILACLFVLSEKGLSRGPRQGGVRLVWKALFL